MINIEYVAVMGWEAAIRGMRNPMNSWERVIVVLVVEMIMNISVTIVLVHSIVQAEKQRITLVKTTLTS